MPDTNRSDLARGVYIEPEDGKQLFKDCAQKWRAGQMHGLSTATQAASYLRVHAYPILGNRPLPAVRRSEIKAWVKKCSEMFAPAAVELGR